MASIWLLRRVSVSVLLLGALLGAGAPALAGDTPLRLVTPPSTEEPTRVVIDLYDLQVFSIEEQSETFHIGGRVDLTWYDTRQAFEAETVGASRLEFQDQAALDKLQTDIWWPDLEFVDSLGARDRMYVNLTIDSDGQIWYRERFTVKIKQDFYLGDFPFDEHQISFSIEPFTYGADSVQFVVENGEERPARWEPTEWVVSSPYLSVYDRAIHVCADSGEPAEGACAEDSCAAGVACETSYDGFSRAEVSMDISRVSSSYKSNIILPLALIVLVSTAVFWMSLVQTHLGDRLGVSFTSLLTVVAFDFVTSDSLPKLWYSTALDRIVTWSYVLLTINIVFVVLADRLFDSGERKRRFGLLLSHSMRWVQPAAYLIGLYLLIP